MSKYTHLAIVCNGCGELMRDLGEWPITYPERGGSVQVSKNLQQSTRYACKTCKTPHPSFERGVPVLISIIECEPLSEPVR